MKQREGWLVLLRSNTHQAALPTDHAGAARGEDYTKKKDKKKKRNKE